MSCHVTCQCGQAFAAPAEYAGQSLPCPVCGAEIFIPPTSSLPVGQLPSYGSRSAGGGGSPLTTLLVVGGIAAALVVIGVGVVVGVNLASHAVRVGSPAPAASTARDEPKPAVASPAASAANVESSQHQAPAASSAPPAQSMEDRLREIEARRRTKLSLGAGMYELSGATFQPLDDQEQLTSAGLTLRGGARWNPQIRTDMIALGDVIFNWAVIIKARPSPPGQNKNPKAREIAVNGLEGLEIQDDRGQEGILHWAFGFEDHSVMIMVRGQKERVHSPEVQVILHSLRRVKPVPKELAERAKAVERQ